MAEQSRIWEHFQNQSLDSFKASSPRLDFLLNRIHSLAKGSQPKVLNIGVGSGYFERGSLKNGFLISALDPDHQAIAKLKSEGVDAKQGSITAMPFSENSFDFVVASEVLEHLKADEGLKALTEIRRILKPQGYFIGTVPYNELLKDNQAFCPNCSHHFHRWGHEQTFNKENLQNLISKELQLSELKIHSFVSFHDRNLRGKLKSAAKWMLGKMGEQVADPHLYFCAQKKDN